MTNLLDSPAFWRKCRFCGGLPRIECTRCAVKGSLDQPRVAPECRLRRSGTPWFSWAIVPPPLENCQGRQHGCGGGEPAARSQDYRVRSPWQLDHIEVPNGAQQVRFRAWEAWLANEPSAAPNNTDITSAVIDPDGRVVVLEGLHRTRAMARERILIDASRGGVERTPGWLDFSCDPTGLSDPPSTRAVAGR
jgi:hypothetical protein